MLPRVAKETRWEKESRLNPGIYCQTIHVQCNIRESRMFIWVSLSLPLIRTLYSISAPLVIHFCWTIQGRCFEAKKGSERRGRKIIHIQVLNELVGLCRIIFSQFIFTMQTGWLVLLLLHILLSSANHVCLSTLLPAAAAMPTVSCSIHAKLLTL